jgi:hypothetical protein
MVTPRLIPFENAGGFIDALRPTNKDYGWVYDKYWQSYWIFRGQTDASLPLIPSAWRTPDGTMSQPPARSFIQHYEDFDWVYKKAQFEETLKQILRKSGRVDITKDEWKRTLDLLLQVYAEIWCVNAFISIANQVGHPIEEINISEPFFDNYFHNLYTTENVSIWLSDIVAIAQHHGISTRYLDWTKNPLIAAFFAAEGVDENTPQDGRLGEFAYNTIGIN